jgi:hypothetical protein
MRFTSLCFLPALLLALIGLPLLFVPELDLPGALPYALAAAPTFTGNEYAGEVVRRALTRAITGNEVAEGGHAFMRDNVRNSLHIPRLSVENIIQDRAPEPTSQGNFEYSHRKLTPLDYMIYLEFNPLDFEEHWFAQLLSGERVFTELPAEIQEQIIDQIMLYHDNYLGQALWTGDTTNGTAPYNKFDGFVTLLANDPETVTPSNPVALTESNVIDKLEETYKLVPRAVRGNANMKCFVSTQTHDLYGDALRNLNYKSISPEDPTPRRFHGKRLVPLEGFPDDTILWARSTAGMNSNLWVGAADLGDLSTIQVERKQANSELFFFKMLVKLGCQVGFPEETVLYKV